MATKAFGKGRKEKKYKYNKIMSQAGIREKIVQWRSEGYSERAVAIELGITYRCLQHWKEDIEEFAELLDQGKEKLVNDLERMAYRKALGKCSVKKSKKLVSDKNGKKTKTVEENVEEVPPDSSLLRWCLVNAAPEKWKDRSIEITGNITSNVVFVNDLNELSDDELLKMESDNLFDDDEEFGEND